MLNKELACCVKDVLAGLTANTVFILVGDTMPRCDVFSCTITCRGASCPSIHAVHPHKSGLLSVSSSKYISDH